MERYSNHAGRALERRFLLASLPYLAIGVAVIAWAVASWVVTGQAGVSGGLVALLVIGCLFLLVPIVGPIPALGRTPRFIRIERDQLIAEWPDHTEQIPFAAIYSTDTERSQFVQGYRYATFVPVPAALRYQIGADAPSPAGPADGRSVDRTLYLTEANLQRVRDALETYRVALHRPGPDDPLPPEEMSEQAARELGEV